MNKRRVVWVLMLAAAVAGLQAAPEATAQSAPDVSLRIAPYIQNVTADGATILWETGDPTRGVVEYARAEAGLGQERQAQEEQERTIHRVRLSGLQPDTAYRYRVRVGAATHEATFKTAPVTGRNLRFAVIGDSRFWGELWQDSRLPDHFAAQGAEFSLHMGDLVNNGEDYSLWPQHFDRFARQMSTIAMFPARGNHERSGADPALDWFGRYFELPGGEPYSSFDWGDAHFAVVSYVAMAGEAMVRTLEFLDRDLGATRKPWKFVAFHYPVYCTGYEGPEDSRKASGNPDLEAVIDRHRVDMVLNGHTHIYERSFPYRGGRRDDRNGTVYLIQGGNVGGNYPDRWSALVCTDIDMPHYTMIEVRDDHLELRSYALAKGTAESGRQAPIVEFDHLILWRDERLPKAELASLQAVDPIVVAAAAERLGAMGYGPAARALVHLLDSEDEAVQRSAALALERVASPTVAAALIPYLDDPDLVVRRHVARALECALPAGLAGMLTRHIVSEAQDPQVRVCLLGALLHHAPEEAYPVAWSQLASPVAEVRARAADVVKRTADQEHIADLLDAFETEEDAYVVGALAWGLNRLTGKDLDVEAIMEADPTEREQFRIQWQSG